MKPVTTKCEHCAHYEATDLFELCTHAKSSYQDPFDKEQWHTVSHMRDPRGWCGEDAKLFKRSE